MKNILILIVLSLVLFSCTDNQKARTFGGTQIIKLQPNEEFINITWKENDIWVVVKDKNTGKFYAREKSSFGVMEGKIIIEP